MNHNLQSHVQRGDVLIIVPTYNERENIESLLSLVFENLAETEVLVVDDGSPDGTGDLVESIAKRDTRVHLLRRPGKLGLGTAYLAGFKYALERDYKFIFEMDADFSHNPKYLPQMVAQAQAGADLVLGSRYMAGGGTENWGVARRFISKGGNIYARAILGVGIHDLTSGFKCFRRELLQSMDLDSVRSEGYCFQIEMTYRALTRGFRVEEIPITFVDRHAGSSKMSKKIVAEAMLMVWRLRFGIV